MSEYKRLEVSLSTDFPLPAKSEDVVCVDLEGEWKEDARIWRHPEFEDEDIVMVSAQVGEGGDHMNITFKNKADYEVTIDGKELVVIVTENPEEEPPPDLADKNKADQEKLKKSGAESVEDAEKVKDSETAEKGDSVDATENGDSVNDAKKEEKENTSKDEDEKSESGDKTDDEGSEKVKDTDTSKATDESKNGDKPEEMDTEDTESSEKDKDASKNDEKMKETVKEDDENAEKVKDSEDKDSKEESEEKEASPKKPLLMMKPFSDESQIDDDDEKEGSDQEKEDEEDKGEGSDKEDGEEKMDTSESASKPEDKEKESGDENSEKNEDKKAETSTPTDDTKEESVKNDGESTTKSDDDSKTDEKKDEKDDAFSSMLNETKKPKLKLASFGDLSKNGTSEAESSSEPSSDSPTTEGCCSHCNGSVPSLHSALVWETMQFCNEHCLGEYQSGMSSCSSCKKEVHPSSLGKYCVRFGSDIKQFCSNVCLEDYKKGLKVCSYCQKDISGGEGFLAPIGDKGQFKDFCEQSCLNKYEEMHLGKKPEKETLPCFVCKEEKLVEQEVLRVESVVKLCSQPCFSAFKFVNGVSTHTCDLCTKHFDTAVPKINIYYDGISKLFCSKPCQNVYVMHKRKIVPCSWCKVKKYNFDMIEKFPPGQTSMSHLYCSLNCLNLHNLHITKQASAGFSDWGNKLGRPQSRSNEGGASLPVISAVSSLASPTGTRVPSLPTEPLHPAQLQPAPPPQIQIQTQTVREVQKETVVVQTERPEVRNKGTLSKPFMQTKGVSCRPHPCHKETQTEGLDQPLPLPIPLPIYVPAPCKMYNVPYPVPIPIPMPFPVPIFIPTTRKSHRGIMKQIKKIQNKIPADPFEAELLALAGNISGAEGPDSDDSVSDGDNNYDDGGDDDDYQAAAPIAIPDLENEMPAERIVPKPLPISTPEPPPPRGMGGYHQNQNMNFAMKRRASERDSDDPEGEGWRAQQDQWGQNTRGRRSVPRPRGRSTPQVKRQRTDNITSREQQAAIAAISQQPKERPDANNHLKFTYGVNAWKHWVVGKNAELEKQRAQGKYMKTFETDILKLRADELNFTLCMFVKEVKKPNGESYAADSIFYLVLGIQEYLFENGRIDNIFTDVYYEPFTSALHEVVADFKLPVNELGYFVTRIEEEHLWESKQLGAHSPNVLLNTLVYFNTKYFQLKTVDQHLKLSFSHIMKHWKKTPLNNKPGQQQRTVLLRYYPPPLKGQKNEERKMYEQHENHENPLRCPVKLYEFYLSKCPESTKNRNDMFYLQPERSCVPDSPVWYSAQLLNKMAMEKMLARLLMVREVQEHMLADAS